MRSRSTAYALSALALAISSAHATPQEELHQSGDRLPAACEELDHLSEEGFTHHEEVAAKQQCNAVDIRAKFAELDHDGDGHLLRSELPLEHELTTRFDQIDFDGDGRLSLAEVAEHDAETNPIE